MGCNPLVLDGTIVREPLSGVHYAVKAQLCALATRAGKGVVILGRKSDFPDVDGLVEVPEYTRAPLGRLFWQQTQLPHLLKRFHAAALYAPAYVSPWRSPVPVILQVHDVIALERPDLCDWKNAAYLRCMMPHSIRSASLVVATSNDVSRRICSHFPKIVPAVLPLAVDSPSEVELRQAGQLHEIQAPYLLFLGNLEPKKGLLTLLKAFELAVDTPFHLVLAGRPAWKSAPILEAIATHPRRQQIHLLGWVSDKRRLSLYRYASALVLPSEEEGFGLPLLEAAAIGTPVIHSDHPALLETARLAPGASFVSFPRNDAVALAEAIRAQSVSSCPVRSNSTHLRTWKQWAEEFLEKVESCLPGL